MKNTLLAIIFILLSNTSYEQYSFIASHSANNSIIIEFKSAKRDIIYGGGVSYFYNKGNKGKDYSGFINDFTSTYQTVIANEGSIFFTAGNKINKNLSCTFRFGLGTVKRYINGIGIPGLPTELWYVRQRLSEDILCGLNFQYDASNLSLSAGWDSFNSFNLGLGFNFKTKNH